MPYSELTLSMSLHQTVLTACSAILPLSICLPDSRVQTVGFPTLGQEAAIWVPIRYLLAIGAIRPAPTVAACPAAT